MRFLAYAIVAAVALSATFAHAAGPTGLLNDTGQTLCSNGSARVACDAATAGDTGTLPRQDGRFGRDVASPVKVGGGAAGFDFTPLDSHGNPIPLTGTPAVPASRPVCVHDNVTNLDWEVKTAGGGDLHDWNNTYSWYDSNPATNGDNAGTANAGTGTCSGRCDTEKFVADVNADPRGFCGTANPNPWRLPTRRELLSIVHNGVDIGDTSIDWDYFLYTQSAHYWTSDTMIITSGAWTVDFLDGHTFLDHKGITANNVRLVRSGQ